MKTLMVDVDNVITDSIFLDLINEFTGKNYILSELKSYYLQELIIDRKEEFWLWAKNKNFYHEAKLFDGCYEVLEKLNKVYDVYIVTAYLWKDTIDISGNNLNNKYNYLKEKLPFIEPEKYIFTTNKNLMNFDIKIDDKLDNLNGASTKLLFTAWHNNDLKDDILRDNNVIRVNNWYDIERTLLEKDKLLLKKYN